jgi:hypothetical protein
VDKYLSSGTTFIAKYVFPPVWIVGFGLGAVDVFQSPQSFVHDGVGGFARGPIEWMIACVWILGTLFILWAALPLKRVKLCGPNLVVSNYFRDWSVPLSDIVSVHQNRWLNIRPIRVALRFPVEGLGSRFSFMPPGRVRSPFAKEDAVVAELREAAHLETVDRESN